MAKQRSIIKLEGTIQDITFSKGKDGYIAKEKSSLSAERIATDEAFARTRENNSEFGRAGKAGKLLRLAFISLLKDVADGKMVSRLTGEMIRVVKSDTINERGKRNVRDGELGLLEGFDFNIDGKLGASMFVPYTAEINRAAGTMSVTVEGFIPKNGLAYPPGSTHFKFIAGAAEIDFDSGAIVKDVTTSLEQPLNNITVIQTVLDLQVSANSNHTLFLVFGLEFFQEVNGLMYPLKAGGFNPLTLVKVNAN